MAEPAVGCRVRILKDYATARYIGPIVNQEGTWVGVEWDDPSRGKHDGSTGGVRYFTCKSGTNSGSFVRIERVIFGVTVLDALRARYNNETAEHGEEVAADQLYVHTSRKRRVQVQLVGEEKIQQKQRQIHALESARLVGLDVSAVGDPSSLSSSVPRLASLDLTCNLVAHWSFLEHLGGAVAGLQLANLSENRIEFPAPSPAPRTRLPGIRVLVLNDCGITWRDVLTVAPQLPSLEELHICGNPIGALHPPDSTGAPAGEGEGEGRPGGDARDVAATPTPPQSGAWQGEPAEGKAEAGSAVAGRGGAEALAALFPQLQVLTLEDALLPGWAPLELLRLLPSLARLQLAGNPGIAQIRYPEEDGRAGAAAHPATGSSTRGDGAAAAACSSWAAGSSPRGAGRGLTAGGGGAGAAGAGSATSATEVGADGGGGGGGAAPGPLPALESFPSLTALYLGGCGVAEWRHVDQLDRFPALRELRLTGNPVLALSKTGGRFEVIGRVSGLQQLNGAEVRPRERRDSELRYLQHIAAEMEAAGQDEARKAAVRSAHPRLRRLMELHGTVLATASRDASSGGSLASSMVEIKLTCVAAAATAKMGTQVKKLPRSTPVSSLRLLCERLFRVPGGRMALFLRAPGDPLPENIGGPEQEDRPLGFFGVQSGWEVLVDEVDPEDLKRADEDARAAAAAAHEQRLAEQLRAVEKLQAEFVRSMGLQQQQEQQQQQQQQQQPSQPQPQEPPPLPSRG